MPNKRRIEIFSAGCPVCEEVVRMVRAIACDSCDVVIRYMHSTDGAARAGALGVTAVPAVAIDGKLPDCCLARGPDESTLRAAGLGVPRP